MNEQTYKHQVVQSAIDGLQDSGVSKWAAESYRTLFEKIFDCGYLECRRVNIQQKMESLNNECPN